MRYWWVNQNQTYKAELAGGFLWSPKKNSNNARNQFYDNMKEVEAGDIIFSFSDTLIKAVGSATGKAESTPKPNFGNSGSNWSDDGWLVPVEFRELDKPIRPKDSIEVLRPLLPKKYSPLQENGNGLQSVYLATVPGDLAKALIKLIGTSFDSALSGVLGSTDADSGINDDIETGIMGRTDIGATTKEQLVKSRRGQGIFKANVRLNEKFCRVTGITDLRHLKASHIKPWRFSNDEEKLNGCNGLLLAPHIDHLFDQGYISFADNGKLLTSKKLDSELMLAWGIDPNFSTYSFNSEQAKFLEFHRINVLQHSTTDKK